MTDSVRLMLARCGFPGMKVLQFAFDSRDSDDGNEHLPHTYDRNCVVYTGTHDNQTIVSWYRTISESERKKARDYLYNYADDEKKIYKSFIALAMQSVADTCIIPIQDWLGLDDRARMNVPSRLGGNWKWRLEAIPEKSIADEIREMTKLYGRI